MKFLLLILLGSTLTSAFAQDQTKTNLLPVQVVERQIEAFNRHDPDELANHVSEDFVWYNVTSDATTVESKTREKLRAGMKSYFKPLPDVKSTIDGVTASGPFVSFRETVSWTNAKGKHSQSSIAVYEVHAGLITRVWYYPASK
jgi:hypothetical protein